MSTADKSAGRFASPLPKGRFLQPPDQCFLARRLPPLCPEPVARNGFSLARNGCRLSASSIPGSKLPACYFASFQITSVPVRPFGSTTACRFAPVAAASLPGARCTSTTRFGLPRLRVSTPLRDFYIPRDQSVQPPLLPAGPPDESARFPLAPRRPSWLKFGLRIIVPGPLRFRRLAVPQTSWNLIHYAPDGFSVNAFFVDETAFSSTFISICFQSVTDACGAMSCG